MGNKGKGKRARPSRSGRSRKKKNRRKHLSPKHRAAIRKGLRRYNREVKSIQNKAAVDRREAIILRRTARAAPGKPRTFDAVTAAASAIKRPPILRDVDQAIYQDGKDEWKQLQDRHGRGIIDKILSAMASGQKTFTVGAQFQWEDADGELIDAPVHFDVTPAAATEAAFWDAYDSAGWAAWRKYVEFDIQEDTSDVVMLTASIEIGGPLG